MSLSQQSETQSSLLSEPPQTPPECQPPSKLSIALELRAPFEWLTTPLKLLASKSTSVKSQTGDGRPIILLPGYMASSRSMAPLKRFLCDLNYSAYHWPLGRNQGNVEADVAAMATQVQSVFEQHQQPVTLIGWSLGGVIARELARLHPEQVREVITLGSPISGGPKYTSIGRYFNRRRQLNLDEIEQVIHERNSLGISQPITSIYSRSDGVVGWRASLDRYNPQARNIRVRSSHLGIGVNLKAWRIIAQTLAGGEV